VEEKAFYTLIQYKDEVDEKTIVLYFGKKIDEAQPLIYHNMLESRKNKEARATQIDKNNQGNTNT